MTRGSPRQSTDEYPRPDHEGATTQRGPVVVPSYGARRGRWSRVTFRGGHVTSTVVDETKRKRRGLDDADGDRRHRVRMANRDRRDERRKETRDGTGVDRDPSCTSR